MRGTGLRPAPWGVGGLRRNRVGSIREVGGDPRGVRDWKVRGDGVGGSRGGGGERARAIWGLGVWQLGSCSREQGSLRSSRTPLGTL